MFCLFCWVFFLVGILKNWVRLLRNLCVRCFKILLCRFKPLNIHRNILDIVENREEFPEGASVEILEDVIKNLQPRFGKFFLDS